MQCLFAPAGRGTRRNTAAPAGVRLGIAEGRQHLRSSPAHARHPPQVWDPVLIIAQIVSVQCLFYLVLGALQAVIIGGPMG
jgi:hypothetical protein